MRIGIIGAGSGGYVAAIRAAQLGGEVMLFEEKWIGGTCLNAGCIPTKALIAGIHAAHLAKESSAFGVQIDGIKIDVNKLHNHKEQVVQTNVKGVEYLINKRGVKVISAHAEIASKNTVIADGQTYQFDKIIIATGSKCACIPSSKIDGKYILSSDHILSMRDIPNTILIVGGGVIGLEFAGILSALGCKVTIVEMMDRLLPLEDEECSRAAMKSAINLGCVILTGTKVTNLFGDGDAVQVQFDDGKEKVIQRFHKALMAIGRSPNLDEPSLRKAGVEFSKKGITVDSFMQTTAQDVYAIGDATGGYMLAHVAYAQAKVAVCHAMGKDATPMRYDNIPRVTFVQPEIASCGLTSSQIAERSLKVKWSKFSYMASGRARAQGIKDGFFKIAIDDEGIIKSAIVVGENAGELISFFSQAMTLETPINMLEEVIIAHPTLAEMCVEVIEVAAGHPLHS